MKFNQVTGDNKIASISDLEMVALTAIGADNSLKELMSARADDSSAKNKMYSDIGTYGYTTLKDLPDNLSDKQTLNTVSQYLRSAGLDNDLLVDLRGLDKILEM